MLAPEWKSRLYRAMLPAAIPFEYQAKRVISPSSDRVNRIPYAKQTHHRFVRVSSSWLERAAVTATCACGQASITVEAPPTLVGVCHCQNCKRRTGSAFGVSAYFDQTAVKARTGETNVYAFHNRLQNHDQQRHFCVRCGTTLFWYLSALPQKIGIAGGCFAGEGLPEPACSVTDRNKEAWVGLPARWRVHHQ